MRALSARVLAKVTSSAVVGADVMVQVTAEVKRAVLDVSFQ